MIALALLAWILISIPAALIVAAAIRRGRGRPGRRLTAWDQMVGRTHRQGQARADLGPAIARELREYPGVAWSSEPPPSIREGRYNCAGRYVFPVPGRSDLS